MKKKIILAIILCFATVVSAGNIIIEEDSLEIGKIRATNRILPNENALFSYGLTGYWPFDDHVLDYSGEGNNGTISGSVSFGSGNVGSAGVFDGSSEYVSIADAPYRFNTGDFTACAWVNADTITGNHMIFDYSKRWQCSCQGIY